MFRSFIGCARKAALLLTTVALLQTASAVAQDDALDKGIVRERAELATGKRMAILVGAQDYDALPKLRFCHADVRLLEKTLKEDCKFDRVITMTDEAAEKRYRPTRSSLIRELGVWLDLANKSEYSQVLVYFSGHGYRGDDQQLYFAPPDCDPKNLEETCLPQAYVRKKLDACDRVKVKLLILDTCHAGETKGASEGIASEDLAAVFKNAKGLYTMASCRSEEVSLEWPAKRQGLFTYWLAEGLKGAADRDGDKLVDTSELYKFTYNQVLETSTELGRVQNVVERPSDDWQGIAVLARVVPATVAEVVKPVTPPSEKPVERPTETTTSQPPAATTSNHFANRPNARENPISDDDFQRWFDEQYSDLVGSDVAKLNGTLPTGGGLPNFLLRQAEPVALGVSPISVDVQLTNSDLPKHAKLFLRIGSERQELTAGDSRRIVVPTGETLEFYTGDASLGTGGWAPVVANTRDNKQVLRPFTFSLLQQGKKKVWSMDASLFDISWELQDSSTEFVAPSGIELFSGEELLLGSSDIKEVTPVEPLGSALITITVKHVSYAGGDEPLKLRNGSRHSELASGASRPIILRSGETLKFFSGDASAGDDGWFPLFANIRGSVYEGKSRDITVEKRGSRNRYFWSPQ